MSFMDKEERDALRQDIARHTQEFLRKGGKIIKVEHGISGMGGNGLHPFRINNTDAPQPRTNNGLFAESTKKRGRKRKIDEVTTEVAGDGSTLDDDMVDGIDGGDTL
jgi:hypothetical protein